MESKVAVTALAALAQETRLAIFRALVQAGPSGLAAGQIAAAVGTPAATVSFHLKELSHAGLIGSRPAGRYIFYSAHYEQMNQLLGFLTENCCAADGVSCVSVRAPERSVARPSSSPAKARPAARVPANKRRVISR